MIQTDPLPKSVVLLTCGKPSDMVPVEPPPIIGRETHNERKVAA